MVLIMSTLLYGISNPNSSLSAITISTESKLSNPRLIWKWALVVTLEGLTFQKFLMTEMMGSLFGFLLQWLLVQTQFFGRFWCKQRLQGTSSNTSSKATVGYRILLRDCDFLIGEEDLKLIISQEIESRFMRL